MLTLLMVAGGMGMVSATSALWMQGRRMLHQRLQERTRRRRQDVGVGDHLGQILPGVDGIDDQVKAVDRLGDVLDRFFDMTPSAVRTGSGKVRETESEILVSLDAPGFDASEFEIQVLEDVLAIRAKQQVSPAQSSKRRPPRPQCERRDLVWLVWVISSAQG